MFFGFEARLFIPRSGMTARPAPANTGDFYATGNWVWPFSAEGLSSAYWGPFFCSLDFAISALSRSSRPLNGYQLFACVRAYIQNFFESFLGSGEWRLRLSHNLKDYTEGKSLSRHATALSHSLGSHQLKKCSILLRYPALQSLDSPKGERSCRANLPRSHHSPRY